MIKLKNVAIGYHMVGEGDDEMLMVMMHFRMFVDEIGKMVGANAGCSVDFFENNHKVDQDSKIVGLFSNRFTNALIGFIKKKRLEDYLITENLLADANDCIRKCVKYFAEHGEPHVINLEK